MNVFGSPVLASLQANPGPRPLSSGYPYETTSALTRAMTLFASVLLSAAPRNISNEKELPGASCMFSVPSLKRKLKRAPWSVGPNDVGSEKYNIVSKVIFLNNIVCIEMYM